MQNTQGESKMKKGSRIVSIPRFTAFIIICTVITTMICMSLIGRTQLLKAEAAQTPAVSYSTVEVSAGDSLWTIAKDNYPQIEDVRSAVREITRANNLSSSTLTVGQELRLPDSIEI